MVLEGLAGVAPDRQLRVSGHPAEVLRLVVLQDTRHDLPRAVLAARAEGRALVLDVVTDDILPGSLPPHDCPQLSLNEAGRRLHIAPDAPS